MNKNKYFRNINTSFTVNLVFVVLIFILITFSGSSEGEIIQTYAHSINDNNSDQFPAITNSGDITFNKGDQINLRDLEFDKKQIQRVERVYVDYTTIKLSDNIVDSIIFFVNDELWNNLAYNETSLIIFEYSNNIAPDNLTTIIFTDINQTLNISIDEISYSNFVPSLFDGYTSSPSKNNFVSIILPLIIYNTKIVEIQHTLYIEENYFINPTYLSGFTSFPDIEYSLLNFWNEIQDYYSTFEKYISRGSYRSKFPLINELYYLESNSYSSLLNIFFISIPKILFIELVLIFGIQLIIKKQEKHFKLYYTRGYSIDQLRKKLITQEIFNILFLILLSLLSIRMLSFSEFQSNILFQIIIPWFAFYLISIIYLLIRNFRNLNLVVKSTENIYTKKKFMISKLLLIAALIMGVLSLINVSQLNTTLLIPTYILYLFWLLVFLIFGGLYFIIEDYRIMGKIYKSRNGHIIKLFFKNINNKKLSIGLIILIIGLNITINQEINYKSNRISNLNQYSEFMGDFALELYNINEGSISNFNYSKYMQIDGIQSILLIFETYINLKVSPTQTNGYILRLVDQGLYEDFNCQNCDKFKKSDYFEDKFWFPDYLSSIFTGNESPLEFDMHGIPVLIDSNKFLSMRDNPGIIVGAKNTILSSFDTWKQLNLPRIDNIEDRTIHLLLSFHDPGYINEATLKSRLNAIGISSNNYQVKTNEEYYRNIFTDVLDVNLLINIIFSVFTTIALMYIFFDEELISNLRIINVKFGNINETKIILASLNFLIIFLTSLSFIIGSSSYYLGFPSALISVKIYQFDYAFNIQLIGYLLLPQIIIQLIGTMYIYKCKIKQLNLIIFSRY